MKKQTWNISTQQGFKSIILMIQQSFGEKQLLQAALELKPKSQLGKSTARVPTPAAWAKHS